jgi:hypothetical protein
VEFVLDLAGYEPSKNLVDALAVEPYSGSAEFFEAIVRRLVGSCKRQPRDIEECNQISSFVRLYINREQLYFEVLA